MRILIERRVCKYDPGIAESAFLYLRRLANRTCKIPPPTPRLLDRPPSERFHKVTAISNRVPVIRISPFMRACKYRRPLNFISTDFVVRARKYARWLGRSRNLGSDRPGHPCPNIRLQGII